MFRQSGDLTRAKAAKVAMHGVHVLRDLDPSKTHVQIVLICA